MMIAYYNAVMTYLLQLPLSISPNSSSYSSSLLSFHLLTLTYHQALPALLFLLYATNHSPSSSTPYSSYFLLVFNTTANAVVNNYTGLPLNCSSACTVKASSSLLLIESYNHIRLYPMLADGVTVNVGSPLLTRAKTWVTPNSTLQYFCSDIFGSYFGYSDGHHLYFISHNPTSSTTASFFFALPTLHSAVYSLSITASSTLLAVQGTSTPLLYVILCTSCVFSYNYTSGSTMSAAMYRTVGFGIGVTYRWVVTRSDWGVESGGNGVLWSVENSNFGKYLLNTTSWTVSLLESRNYSVDVPGISGNHKKAIIWSGSSSILLQDYSQSSTSESLTIPGGQTIHLAALSNNSLRMTLLDSASPTSLRSFMLVANCSLYHATANGQLCLCNQYVGYECKLVESASGGSSSGEGTKGWVFAVAAVAGVVVLTVAGVVGYKVWIRCQKIARRSAWKYNAREFIDLEA